MAEAAESGAAVGAGASGSPWQFDFRGRRVVVTGGSRGLGLQMARAFSQLGAEVVIASRKLENCEAAAAAIAQETGGTVHPLQVRMTDWESVESFAQQVLDRVGAVDVLVNNAGSSPLYDSVAGIGEELFDKVLGLNLKGPFRLAALFAEQMPAGGSIVNISSIAARHPRASTLPYSAAKAGLEAATVALAHAYGPGVRVNAVVPGTFLTDVSKHWDMESFQQRAESFALKRGGDPEEIVGAVLYLSSPMASYTTGSLLTVDGGAPA
ncbi:SDR family NAD(P)-dependent oxidoreductase [Brevibacterium litoralis]|uniref:SDR family NAD(P)-dependent oxidoreductase n=1 Tax=Brevibacterium litoralis TaxID=3138935 RepID=UPI0032EC63F7